MKSLLKNNRGIALVLAIMLMVVLLSFTGAGLLFSGLNLKTANNFKAGSNAVHVADTGIQHALAIIPSGANFTYGSGATLVSATPFPDAASGYSYVVTATNNPSTNPSTSTAILTSTATGPNGSKRVIKAYVGRSSGTWVPPGAIYLPGQPANVGTTFTGGSFLVTGTDTNPGGSVGSGSAGPVPGISTSDSAAATAITGPSGSLSSSQYGQVTGQGASPSVATLSTSLDVNQLAENLLSLGVEGVDKLTLPPDDYKIEDLATGGQPKIIRITGNTTLKCGSGNNPNFEAPSGVLIVDGNMTVNGYFKFNGLVIVRGENVTIQSYGKIHGALLVKQSTTPGGGLTVGGNSNLYYSSQALSTVLTNWGSALPQKARLIAWHEVMQ